MKVVILAGGKGTRISEESKLRPKPMVEIGGKPILWHIMKQYAYYGFNDFIICCGYKGHMIKEYFVNYHLHNNNMKFSTLNSCSCIFGQQAEPWKVTLVDTGLETLTAGRLKKVQEYIGNEQFMLTYGDGIADINVPALLDCHQKQGKIVTISATQPEGRFGVLQIDDNTNQVLGFKEKARKDQAWINIGYMVMEPEVFSYLGTDDSMLEREPFEKLASGGELAVYRHNDFWAPMDNVHDRDYLEKLWNDKAALWMAGRQ